jgi:hypothetical protein
MVNELGRGHCLAIGDNTGPFGSFGTGADQPLTTLEGSHRPLRVPIGTSTGLLPDRPAE